MPGGKRPGAGRPKGARNKRTLETLELAKKLGIDPIGGQLELAAWALQEFRKETEKQPRTAEAKDAQAARLDALAKQASDCLAKAAPYLRPKLAAIDHSTDKRFKTHEEAMAEIERELGPDGVLSDLLGDDDERDG